MGKPNLFMEQERSNTCDCKGCTWIKNSKMMHCHFWKMITRIIFILFIFWLGVQVGMVKSFSKQMRAGFNNQKQYGMMKFGGAYGKRVPVLNDTVVTPTTTDTTIPPKQ